MRTVNDMKIEYLEKNIEKIEQENQPFESATYNRRNVDNIKRFILVSCVVMCAIPVFFCLYLMVKMNSLEARENALKEKLSVMNQVTHVAQITESTEILSKQDALLLEQEAADDLEKDPGESTHVLMGSDEQADYNDGDVTHISTSANLNSSGNISDKEGSGELMEANPTTESESVSVKSKYKVYLTFDDGPSINTDEILDVLKANDVKATFFVVYTPDEKLWPLYQRIVDEGHTLAMHSYTHVYEDIYSSEQAFKNDVTLIKDFLYQQTGVDCKFYRFPGGSSNSVSDVDIQKLMGYLYEDGITYYDWNSLSEDAMDLSLTPEQLNENVMSSVRSNSCDSIVLLHDLRDNPNTAKGLQALIDTLKEEGYQICPIDDNTIPVQHVTYDNE